MKIIHNTLNKAKIVSVSILAIIMFTACGGGGGDGASFSNSETLIDITIPCVTNNPTSIDISNYVTLYSGDVIVKDSANAQVSIYHDVNGTKKVCLVIPSAHIVRQ